MKTENIAKKLREIADEIEGSEVCEEPTLVDALNPHHPAFPKWTATDRGAVRPLAFSNEFIDMRVGKDRGFLSIVLGGKRADFDFAEVHALSDFIKEHYE